LALDHGGVVEHLLDGCLACLGPFRMRVIALRLGSRLCDVYRLPHIGTAAGFIGLPFRTG
jgi:hypothetical protein